MEAHKAALHAQIVNAIGMGAAGGAGSMVGYNLARIVEDVRTGDATVEQALVRVHSHSSLLDGFRSLKKMHANRLQSLSWWAVQ